MKKIIICILCAALMLLFLTLPAYAADANVSAGEYETVFMRMGEFAVKYKEELLEAASAAAMITTSVIVGVKNGKKSKEISSAVAEV